MLRLRIWICGRRQRGTLHGWVFMGAFWTKRSAVRACIDNTYFIGPARLGEYVHDEVRTWPGAYYPRANGPVDMATEGRRRKPAGEAQQQLPIDRQGI